MGNRVLAVLMLFVMVMCLGAVFVVVTMRMLGIEMPVISASFFPEFKTVVFSVLFLAFFSAFCQVCAFWFAKIAKNKVHDFFDKRWLPRKGQAETYTTSFGERLEKVVSQSYYGTTVWEMATKTMPSAFLLSFVSGASVLLAVRLMGGQPWLFTLPLVLLTNIVVIPWSYWKTEWVRKYTKFIVFTFNALYVKARTPLLSLFFWRGTLPQKSETPISEIRDTQISADPEQFDPKFKTSWLRDQYISWLSEKTGLRTLFIRSKTNEAEDTLFWVDHGAGLDKILRHLREKVSQVQMEKSFIQQNAVRLKTGNGEDREWTPAVLDIEAKSYLSRFAYDPLTYDIFRVEDPGIYDDLGNLKEEPEVEKTVGGVSHNVSEHFLSTRKRQAEMPKDLPPEANDTERLF